VERPTSQVVDERVRRVDRALQLRRGETRRRSRVLGHVEHVARGQSRVIGAFHSEVHHSGSLFGRRGAADAVECAVDPHAYNRKRNYYARDEHERQYERRPLRIPEAPLRVRLEVMAHPRSDGLLLEVVFGLCVEVVLGV